MNAIAERIVIPAKAGIQSNMMCEAHDIKVLSASHDVFKLDSGFRRNDVHIFHADRHEVNSLILLVPESKNVEIPQPPLSTTAAREGANLRTATSLPCPHNTDKRPRTR